MVGRVVVGVVTLLGITSPAVAAPVEVKVKVETSLPDSVSAVRVLERLNANGEAHNLHFEMVEDGYQFRIAVGTQGWNGLRAADARAAVLASDGQILFIISRYGRFTQSGALNAATKEIARRLALRLSVSQSASSAK